MSELYKIILTSALTVVGGVFVFVLGQIVVKFVIEPIQEQRKLIGEIANSLIFFANVGARVEEHYFQQLKYVNELEEPKRKVLVGRFEQLINDSWKKSDDAAILLRQQASSLMGATNSITFYKFWALVGIVPKYEKVIQASSELVRMSNSAHKETSTTDGEIRIAQLLNIKVSLERFKTDGYIAKKK